MSIKKRLDPSLWVLLLIIPLFAGFISINTIEKRKGTIYLDYDPSYAYLYNSVNIATFKVPGHFDHPGTTMQIIGGLVLECSWLINPYGGDSLAEAVIKEPEHYIFILNYFVTVLSTIFLFVAGIFIFHITGNLAYGTLIQLSPFISSLILYNGFTRISQESILMIASISLAALAVHWFFHQEDVPPKHFSKWFGIISGIGIASKVIFLPLIVIPLILINENKEKLRFLKITILVFIICTLPIIIKYPNMVWWFIKLFLHSGIYGSGNLNVIDPSNYIISFKETLIGEPLFLFYYLLTLLFLGVLFIIKNAQRKDIFTPDIKILLAIFITQSIGYIITAKHPKLTYLLPYECIAPATVIICIHIMRNLSAKKLHHIVSSIIIPLSVITITISQGYNINKLIAFRETEILKQRWKNVVNLASEGAIIGINPGPTQIAANYFGNVYSGNKYADLLMKISPDYYIFDTYSNNLINWKNNIVTLKDLAEKYNHNIVLVGNDVDPVIEILTSNNKLNFKKITSQVSEVALLTK